MEPTYRVAVAVLLVTVIGIGIVSVGLPGDEAAKSTEEFNNEFETFNSEAEFNTYISTQQSRVGGSIVRAAQRTAPTPRVETTVGVEASMSADSAESAGDTVAQSSGPVSQESTDTPTSIETRQTNTQEAIVGEPDIVKVTPKRTYYAPPLTRVYTPRIPQPIIEPRVQSESRDTQPQSQTVQAVSNPNTGNVSITGGVNATGKLLRTEDTLVAYNDSIVTGYNTLTDGSNAAEAWSLSFNTTHSVETSRRIGDTAYFVTRERTQTCPTTPIDGREAIDCTDIYYPSGGVDSVDSVYTVLAVDMRTGEVVDTVSFIGSTSDTTVYMSAETLYVSYSATDFGIDELVNIAIQTDHISEDSQVADELRSVESLNISREAKLAELESIISSRNLGSDFRRQLESNITNYVSENRRDIFTSNIVSIEVSETGLSPGKTGRVPGVPLNQFSFDEKDGELRVATTVSPNDRQSSMNDVYILDDELDVTGSVQGMAEGQRIYAVRFIDDRAYVITYRQVDPLHVIDLTDPTMPEEIGTLKLPGFSEYLHKVGDGKLLGVGESADGLGKVVLFDVTDGENPRVADSLTFNQRSTAVSESHHAFMNDGDMNNAYIPARNTLHVVNYSNNTLQTTKSISLPSSAERTRIYNDNVVIFGSQHVTNVEKPTYNVTKTIPLKQ